MYGNGSESEVDSDLCCPSLVVVFICNLPKFLTNDKIGSETLDCVRGLGLM